MKKQDHITDYIKSKSREQATIIKKYRYEQRGKTNDHAGSPEASRCQ